MKLKSFLAATIFSTAAFTNAQAADVVIHKQPAPVIIVPAFSWTGFYLGAQGAYSFGNEKDVISVSGEDNKRYAYEGKSKPKGWMGGAFVGFNTDFANDTVFGIETDFNWGKVKNDVTYKYLDENKQETGESLSLNATEKWNGATRIRLGYSADRVMPYIAAGVAYANLATEGAIYPGTASNTRADDSSSGGGSGSQGGGGSGSQTKPKFTDAKSERTFIGWTIGAGIDYAALDNVMLRLEYRYNNYGKKKATTEEKLTREVSYSTNDIRLGIAYKF